MAPGSAQAQPAALQPAVEDAAAPPFAVRKLTVRPDRIVAIVCCAPGSRMTTPGLAQRSCAARPNLPQHACVNEKGPTFAAVMGDTPLPHLFEHLVIDLLIERSSREDAVFVGTSEWVDEAAGEARVEVSFVDDLDALAAIRDAADVLNALVCG